MKNLVLMFGAVILGFVMTSCGGSPKDAIIQDVDNYFTQLEQELQGIDNADDFMAFWKVASDKSDILKLIDEKYGNKMLSEEESEIVKEFIRDRAESYNQAEIQRFAELFTPVLERYEKAVDAFWTVYQSGGIVAGKRIDEATFNAMDKEYEQAEAELMKFAAYDNILPSLMDRFTEAAKKHIEMFGDEE